MVLIEVNEFAEVLLKHADSRLTGKFSDFGKFIMAEKSSQM